MARQSSVTNFGCRLNSFESDQIGHILQKTGREDLLVVNSCAVTNEAERQVKQKIRSLAKQYPEKTIAVVGCAAELHPEDYARMDGVSLVLGNGQKLQEGAYRLDGAKTQVVHQDSLKKKQSNVLSLNNFNTSHQRTRAEVMVQNGCDHDCTFCAITMARGDSRSVPEDQVIAYGKKLASQGTKELVLTGVDISAYGQDLSSLSNLGKLVKRIFTEIPELPRLRLSSIDCIELDQDLLEVVGNESRLMPHLHLSLQAGDNMILKRMKRRHSREQAIELCQSLQSSRPELVFGADIMAGFPTETEAMFMETLDLVEKCNLTYLHVFPFSARKGTPAAKIPNQIPMAERKRRAGVLRAYSEQRKTVLYESLEGKVQQVLIETQTLGRTPQFVPIHLAGGEEYPIGEIVPLKIALNEQGQPAHFVNSSETPPSLSIEQKALRHAVG